MGSQQHSGFVWLLVFVVLLSFFLVGCQGIGSKSYQLNVTAPATGGTVVSNPAGINCPGTCSASFVSNTQVSLTATPASNYVFTGWSGACSGSGSCNVMMTAAQSVTAAFIAGFGLTVTLAGTGGGTVTSSPAGINCSTGTCSAGFPQNTQVTLAATPASGSVFNGWSGACTSSENCSVTLSASASVTATFNPGGTIMSLNHIIFFAQENRSLDHYFGQMAQYWAQNGYGAGQTFDGLPQSGTSFSVPGCKAGTSGDTCSPDPTNPISSFHFDSVCQENQSPFWNEAHNDWDYSDPTGSNPNDLANPPLNGFVWTAAYDAAGFGFNDVLGIRAMGYLDGNDLNYYYYLASNFSTSDRWFAPVMSRTELNRMYLMAATSQGYAYPIFSNSKDSALLTAKTIFEALQDAGITWKIYVNPAGISYNGAACNSDISDTNSRCLINSSYINMFNYEQTIINSAGQNPDLLLNIAPISQFAVDAQNGTLPAFAFIEPASAAGLDEHPSDSDQFPVNVQTGANYVYNTIIKPFMQSPSWTDSALIFTYDEPGGYFDHVPPQAATPPGDFLSPVDLQPGDICDNSSQLGTGLCDFSWTGYRVPVIVISPYSVKNFVSHTVRDTTSALALVESRFGLSSLTNRDKAQPSMNEFFDFVNKPWATPPNPPPPNTGGTCSLAAPTAATTGK